MADAEALKQTATSAPAVEISEFDELLKKEIKPKSDAAKTAMPRADRTAAEQDPAGTRVISDAAIKSIDSIIAEIDRKLTQQIDAILHLADLQALQGAWRGLHHLVSKTETDEKLKIRVLTI